MATEPTAQVLLYYGHTVFPKLQTSSLLRSSSQTVADRWLMLSSVLFISLPQSDHYFVSFLEDEDDTTYMLFMLHLRRHPRLQRLVLSLLQLVRPITNDQLRI